MVKQMNEFEKLTTREEEVMNSFWMYGDLFVKDLLEKHPEPKPHVNTLSTIVRTLEEKGLLNHRSYGNTYQYFPIVTKEEYSKGCLDGVVSKYFDNSALTAVSALVKEEKISLDELKELIRMVENKK